MLGGGFGAFLHVWLSERLEHDCIPMPTVSSPQLTSVTVSVCVLSNSSPQVSSLLDADLKSCSVAPSVSSFTVSFLASCLSTGVQVEDLCQSLVERVGILIIFSLFFGSLK